MMTYTPQNWHWIVAGDETKAWSSAKSAYVTEYPKDAVTRIDTEENLSDVLRPYGLKVPKPTAYDVREECSRRILARYPMWKQINTTRLSGNGPVTMALFIDAHRSASNKMEASPPDDFADDKHWPS